MSDFKKTASGFKCPICDHVGSAKEIKLRSSSALKGSGGCVGYGTCPNCGHDGCAKRDTPSLKPRGYEPS
ncbi:hypothetical protein [Vibrio anguillarum]|uniref:Uncharacterized protein n=1 Tax=Vibrio anguillarum TaxID=55601 RepID=A0A7U6J3N8_VIBAN|nr:hypothetical protein [Vibrio anguillarum]AZS26313.1 hypothetical protein DYL72_15505 [Vibrio anguillarum]MBF4374457.1 hypothetical protein [Vibrio anguillarum]